MVGANRFLCCGPMHKMPTDKKDTPARTQRSATGPIRCAADADSVSDLGRVQVSFIVLLCQKQDEHREVAQIAKSMTGVKQAVCVNPNKGRQEVG